MSCHRGELYVPYPSLGAMVRDRAKTELHENMLKMPGSHSGGHPPSVRVSAKPASEASWVRDTAGHQS
jgi:hypothetical protein